MKHVKGRAGWGFLLVTLLMMTGIYFYRQQEVKPSPTPALASAAVLDTLPLPEPEPQLLYGFVVDDKNVIIDQVKQNESLGSILNSYNVSHQQIYDLAIKSKTVFDVRRFAVNKKYTLICDKDSLGTARAMVYEPNELEYVVFDLSDSLNIYREQRHVDTVMREVSGVIDHSVYVNMVERKGLSPMLVNKLVDVFGWQIDFFRVQKNDKFRVIYEELTVNGQPIGIGKIHGAWFEHFNNPFYAVYYDQGAGEDYFDEQGNSLRKAFLRAPLEYTRISSRYTGRRYHPVQKRWKAHLGTDYAAPTGTPIRAVGDGIILEARYSKYNGNYVKLKHNSTYTTQYLHMSKIASGMKPGGRVKQGQVIGYVGSTGLATGPHLCYRFWKNGQQVDALKVYIPPSEPIKEENKANYEVAKLAMMAKLDAIVIEEEKPEEPEKMLAGTHFD